MKIKIILLVSLLIGCGTEEKNTCGNESEILQEMERVYDYNEDISEREDLRQCYFNIPNNKPTFSKIFFGMDAYYCYSSDFTEYKITLCGLEGDWKIQTLQRK